MGTIRLSDLAPQFHHLLAERGHGCTPTSAGVAIAALTAADAVDAMCRFIEDFPLTPTAHPAPHEDAPLFQVTPRQSTGPATVNITRQAYRGAGRSVQLSLDVTFMGDLDPSDGVGFNMWSWDAPSLDAFLSMAFGELACRSALFVPCPGLLRIDRF